MTPFLYIYEYMFAKIIYGCSIKGKYPVLFDATCIVISNYGKENAHGLS